MIWIDRLEKAGRLVLWLSLASAVVLVPVVYIRQRSVESQAAEAARKEALALAERAKEESEKSDRLSLKSMAPVFTLLNESTATGRAWFSNVSPRSGIVCLVGIATSASRNMTIESLASCKQISAYATNIEMQVMFAGGDLAALCKGVSCTFTLREVPDAAIGAVAAAP
jgi:hypothetical protein